MARWIITAIVIGLVAFVIIVGIGYASLRIIFRTSMMTVEPGITVDPSNTGGERLEKTNNIRTMAGHNFSISPDGQWIFYPYVAEPEFPFNPFEPTYTLYDINKRERREVRLSPRVRVLSAEGLGPTGVGCWHPNGTQLFLPGSPYTLFVLKIEPAELQLEVLENVDQSKYFYYNECPSLAPEVTSIVQVVQRSSRRVDLVDAQNPERVLASHRAGLTVFTIKMGSPSISPDGKRVAYVVTGDRGGFVAPPRGYVLNLALEGAMKPQLLAAPVFGPIRWGPDSRFVYATVGGKQGGEDIYRWEMNNER